MAAEIYQGKPCKYSHSGVRYILSNHCVDCIKERNKKQREDPEFVKAKSARCKKRRLENSEYYKARQRRWRENNLGYVKAKKERQRKRRLENPEKYRLATRRWQENNPDKHKLKNRRWRQNNLDKCRLSVKRWRQNNPAKNRAMVRMGKLKRKLCVPSWADFEKIESYYIEADRLTEEIVLNIR